MASKAVGKAYAKFQRLNKLTTMEMEGDAVTRQAIRKVKKAMNDHWTNREPRSLVGFFNAKVARAIKRGAA